MKETPFRQFHYHRADSDCDVLGSKRSRWRDKKNGKQEKKIMSVTTFLSLVCRLIDGYRSSLHTMAVLSSLLSRAQKHKFRITQCTVPRPLPRCALAAKKSGDRQTARGLQLVIVFENNIELRVWVLEKSRGLIFSGVCLSKTPTGLIRGFVTTF